MGTFACWKEFQGEANCFGLFYELLKNFVFSIKGAFKILSQVKRSMIDTNLEKITLKCWNFLSSPNRLMILQLPQINQIHLLNLRLLFKIIMGSKPAKFKSSQNVKIIAKQATANTFLFRNIQSHRTHYFKFFFRCDFYYVCNMYVQ